MTDNNSNTSFDNFESETELPNSVLWKLLT